MAISTRANIKSNPNKVPNFETAGIRTNLLYNPSNIVSAAMQIIWCSPLIVYYKKKIVRDTEIIQTEIALCHVITILDFYFYFFFIFPLLHQSPIPFPNPPDPIPPSQPSSTWVRDVYLPVRGRAMMLGTGVKDTKKLVNLNLQCHINL